MTETVEADQETVNDIDTHSTENQTEQNVDVESARKRHPSETMRESEIIIKISPQVENKIKRKVLQMKQLVKVPLLQ